MTEDEKYALLTTFKEALTRNHLHNGVRSSHAPVLGGVDNGNVVPISEAGDEYEANTEWDIKGISEGFFDMYKLRTFKVKDLEIRAYVCDLRLVNLSKTAQELRESPKAYLTDPEAEALLLINASIYLKEELEGLTENVRIEL